MNRNCTLNCSRGGICEKWTFTFAVEYERKAISLPVILVVDPKSKLKLFLYLN